MSDYNDGLLPEPCLRMDTHFGDEYESVEFGDGTGYVKAASMLARLGALHVELDELRDENARLRSFLSDDAENARLIMGENAKLREERDMYRDLVGMMDHPDLNAQLQAENAKLQSSNEVIAKDHAALCEHNAKLRKLLDYMTPIAWYAASERERDRMRELGVEVE